MSICRWVGDGRALPLRGVSPTRLQIYEEIFSSTNFWGSFSLWVRFSFVMLRIVVVTLITINQTLILSLIQVLILYVGGLKAQYPIAHGKRSDTLGYGEFPRLTTLCKSKGIMNWRLYAFALTERINTFILHSPGCRYACPGLCACWAFSPFFA